MFIKETTPTIDFSRSLSSRSGRLTLSLMILALVAAFASSALAQSVVYNAVDSTLAPNYPSLGFQANQTAEFGDYVHLAGTDRSLTGVTVTMSDWAIHSDYPLMPAGGWSHPFTINIYNVVPGSPLNTKGLLIATTTQTKTVPWRPEADPTCAGGTAWRAGDGQCYNGFAFNLTFNMPSATLPNNVIVSIAYNTETWGANPIGAPGPYDSLNVAALGSASVGTDDNTDRVFWNTSTANDYADHGAAGVGVFREDTAWTPNGTPNFQITAETCANVTIPNVFSLSGVSVTVPVNTSDITSREAYSADFTINYNSSKLTPTGANFGVALGTVGNSSGGGRTLTVSNPSAGTLIISIFGSPVFAGSGDLVNLHFNVVGVPLDVIPVTLASFNYNEGVPCTINTNGSVTVISGTISGTVTYGNILSPPSLRGVPGVLISAAGSPNRSTTTAATPTGTPGTYSLGGFGAGAYSIAPSKTGGSNGAITSFDASKIAQYVVGMTPLNPTQLTVADVSGNGTVSSFDASLIARFAAGLGAPLGSSGNWIFSPASRGYSTIYSDVSGQDYSALLMGDVTGNWDDPTPHRAARMSGPERPTSVTAPRLRAPADSEVIVPVSVQGTANKGISSYEFDLRYDPAVIQPQENPVDVAKTVSGQLSTVVNAENPGLLRVVAYGAYPLTGNGVLLNLRFTSVGAAGSVSPLTFERLVLNEGGPVSTTVDGQVELSAKAPNTAEISGRLLTAMGQGVSNARVTLTDTTGQSRSILSNGFGIYRFAGLQVGQTYTISVESRPFTFTPLTVSVTDQMASVDMIAQQ